MHVEHQRPAVSTGLSLTPILSLGIQPLANNLVPPDRVGEPDPEFPLELMWCDDLKLVQLSVSVPPTTLFSEYLYLTSFSPALVSAAHEHVDQQVAARGFGPGDLAMEIGSNDGYLLQYYRQHGLDVLGIDPAENVIAVAEERGVPTRCAFFGVDLAQGLVAEGFRPKIVHANNVMAHIPDVDGVMRGMETLLHDDGVFVTETPYVRWMVDRLEFDTTYHEHLYYYSLTSYAGLLRRNGLEAVDVQHVDAHGGSLRITAARAGRYQPSPAVADLLADEEARGMNSFAYYETFGDRVHLLLSKLAGLIEQTAAEGASIAGYGAAAKATVLLNALGPAAKHVQWVADRSTVKQGHLIPGVRIPVVPVERIDDECPSHLLVLAWNYFDEIVAQLDAYRSSGGKFIRPMPVPQVVS
jgi:SAM-dependent methyltransferase